MTTILCNFKPNSNSKLVWYVAFRAHFFTEITYHFVILISIRLFRVRITFHSFIHSFIYIQSHYALSEVFFLCHTKYVCIKVLNITHYVRTNVEQVNVENFDFPSQISRQSGKYAENRNEHNDVSMCVRMRVYVPLCDI